MPPWLRILVLSNILGDLAGFICEPDLSSVVCNLEAPYEINIRIACK